MKTSNFQNLIQSITKRELVIDTTDENILNGKEYLIYKILPLTNRAVSFKFVAPLSDEKMLRAFITAFTTKYREPNPAAYTTCSPYFAPSWDEKKPIEQEYAYSHHAANMYHKKDLLQQIEANFNTQDIETALIRYGFYNTEYGIGIFCFWATDYVIAAINKMKVFLAQSSIPFSNEYSDARWVYRFKLNLTKEAHGNLLKSFSI